MARYKTTKAGYFADEKVRTLSLQGKLVWAGLLNEPLITPMGAGEVHPFVFGETLGLSMEEVNEAFDMLVTLDMILRDGRLIILKNYLLPDYNLPESSHTMKGWLRSCETLPRSPQFAILRDYLNGRLGGEPTWLFKGLLNPLAEGVMLGLDRLFWERTGILKPDGGRDHRRGGSRGVSIGPLDPQYQEQYQEQEQEHTRKKVPASRGGVGAQNIQQGEEEKSRKANRPNTPTDADTPKRPTGSKKDFVAPEFSGGAPGFEKFWAAYPKKSQKHNAFRLWQRLKPDGELIALIMLKLSQARATESWLEQNGRFVPNPASWLQARGWLDEYVTVENVIVSSF